jgi:protocatechuate 3,4-dioxygenase beta subunit
LTSQLFISGHPANARDFLYRRIGGIIDRELVSAQWRRIQESRIVEHRASFDIVLGVTPEDRPRS